MRKAIIAVLFTAALIFAEKPFWGNLSVTVDKPDVKLPVYVNGEYRGVAPLKIDSLPVGNYTVSFISDGLRDSLTDGSAGYEQLPDEIKRLYGGNSDNQKRLLRPIAELSELRVVVQYEATASVVFPLAEIDKQVASYESGAKKFVIAGVGVLVALGIYLITLL
ncbi:MAG: PEGA domain-containing protein [Fibrobacteres bacterium]|nr:PEGA domain-containing protein [Fibrobacterota bacterium]